MGQEVSAHAVILLAVSDHRLDGGSAFDQAFDGGRDAPFLALGVDPELVLFQGRCGPLSCVGEDARQGCASYGFDAGKHPFERVTIVRIAR